MSGQLPSWLADWLGARAAPAGDGAMWRLDSAWTWAPWATLLLVVLTVLWTVMVYAREQASAGRRFRGLLIILRLLAMAALLVMLAQWTLAIRLTGPPSLAILIDRSASMSISDRYGDRQLAARLEEQLRSVGLTNASRLSLAKLLIMRDEGRLLSELSKRYQRDVYIVAEAIERLPRAVDDAELLRAVGGLTADGVDSQATRLGDAVEHVLADYRGRAPAAIVLFTDGVTTAGIPLGDAATSARRSGTPLIAVGLGNDESPRDVRVADVLVDETVFANDLVNFQIQVQASALAGENAQIILRREDLNESPSVKRDMALPANGETLSVQLFDRPTAAGDATYVVEVLPLDDEINIDNNRERRLVTVRNAKIRVLLAGGYPNYEFRFLKSLLERDSTIELSTFLQDADSGYAEQDISALRSFPVGGDDLFDYDVLVIDDLDPRLLPRSTWQHMRTFVAERGGGVVLVAGPRWLPHHYGENAELAGLLPFIPARGGSSASVSPAAFNVRPTPLGLVSPPLQIGDTLEVTEQAWRKLAPHYWLAEVGPLKPAAVVLADAGPPDSATVLRPGEVASRPRPVIVFQFVGSGRVLFHTIDSTWRWRKGVGEACFARYWLQAIRFLARGKLQDARGVQVTTDRSEYRVGEPVQVRARFRDQRLAPASDVATVTLEAAGEPRRQIALRRNPAAAGVFEGSIAGLIEGDHQLLLVDPPPPSGPPTARFRIVAPPGELARTEMDRRTLAAAAEATGGRFYTIADADRLLSELPAGRRVPIENLPPIPLWNRWWLLALFLACLTSEWILLKRKGML